MRFPDVYDHPVAELLSQAGKQIVVTGASLGIGAAVPDDLTVSGLLI
jgi:NADP-dependent 3-hydroxy acid dehydrogenase YdfG